MSNGPGRTWSSVCLLSALLCVFNFVNLMLYPSNVCLFCMGASKCGANTEVAGV